MDENISMTQSSATPPADVNIKKKNIKLPAKTKMNLAQKDREEVDLAQVIPITIALIAFVFLFSRIGVIDRLNKINEMSNENEALRNKIEELDKKLADYDEVKEKYRRYSTNFLNEDELALVGRLDIIHMLEECVGDLGYVSGISIKNNNIVFGVQAKNLDDIGIIKKNIEEYDDTVIFVYVNTANKNDNHADDATLVTASISITVQVPENEEGWVR